MRRYWLRLRRFIALRMLHADDTPHAIALGTAVAVFVAFLPLMGIQTVLAIAIAALLRANKAVCIPMVWITNPFTVVPLYGSCWAVGRFVMGSSGRVNEEAILARLAGLTQEMSMFEAAFWRELFAALAKLGLELWIGCLLVGAVSALASYFLARYGVTQYREQRRRRVLRRQLFRSKLAQDRAARQTEPT